MGRREARKERNREALVAAAERLFAEHGYDAVTVEQIAATAGVSRRTFFRYFPSKQDVCFAGQRARMAAFTEVMRAARAEPGPGTTAWEIIGRGLLAVAELLMADRDRALMLRRVISATPELRREDLLHDATWEVMLRDEFCAWGDSPLLARVRAGALMGASRAVLDGWMREGGVGDLVAMSREAFSMLDGGLGRRAAA